MADRPLRRIERRRAASPCPQAEADELGLLARYGLLAREDLQRAAFFDYPAARKIEHNAEAFPLQKLAQHPRFFEEWVKAVQGQGRETLQETILVAAQMHESEDFLQPGALDGDLDLPHTLAELMEALLKDDIDVRYFHRPKLIVTAWIMIVIVSCSLVVMHDLGMMPQAMDFLVVTVLTLLIGGFATIRHHRAIWRASVEEVFGELYEGVINNALSKRGQP